MAQKQQTPERRASRTGAKSKTSFNRDFTRGRFLRERLPHPLAYFSSQAIEFSGEGAWLDAACPFHGGAGLRIHAETGAFRCAACGVSGLDILAFHRRLHPMSFEAACRALGAWADR